PSCVRSKNQPQPTPTDATPIQDPRRSLCYPAGPTPPTTPPAPRSTAHSPPTPASPRPSNPPPCVRPLHTPSRQRPLHLNYSVFELLDIQRPCQVASSACLERFSREFARERRALRYPGRYRCSARVPWRSACDTRNGHRRLERDGDRSRGVRQHGSGGAPCPRRRSRFEAPRPWG